MATVPNWIAKAIVFVPAPSHLDPGIFVPTASWRAAKTQVIVTLDVPERTEVRFYLDGLREVGHHGRELLDPSDPKVMHRMVSAKSRRSVNDLQTAVALARLDQSRGNAEELVTKISAIQRAATKALADLADLL